MSSGSDPAAGNSAGAGACQSHPPATAAVSHNPPPAASGGEDRRDPLWVKCPECKHCWAAAYLPMDVPTFTKVTRGVRCPNCGHGKPVIAKQDNGKLLEEVANG